MSENQEIEAKYLLTADLYQQLRQAFPRKQSFQQANYYYDTADCGLRRHFCGLRIRIFNDHAEETMKVPDPKKRQTVFHEVIEINDELDLSVAKQLVSQQQIFLAGQVGSYLHQNFPNYIPLLRQFSWSKTNRSLLNGPNNCELTLDQTHYPDEWTDFELEIENTDPVLIKQTSDWLQEKFKFHPAKNECNQNKVDRATQHRLSI